MRRLPAWLVLACCACTSGDLDAPRPLPSLDAAYFRCRVQPVLVTSCAALACHGNGLRYFRVFGRNRMRAGLGEGSRNVPLLPAELAGNCDAARALVEPGAPDRSWLLQKALDVNAGGWSHPGADFGQGNVFLSKDDPGYVTLAAWIRGAQEDPSCTEPGSSP